MRKFIDIISEGISLNHNRIEIIFSKSAELLLESFTDPVNELKINYRIRYNDQQNGKLYIVATVIEISSNIPVIEIDYTLGDTNMVVSNVVSFRNDKHMFTSNGQQIGATDMGFTAMKWIYSNILTDAKNRGFDCTKIVSGTRYTGARAKNGMQNSPDDLPINYDVNQDLRERFIYTLKDDLVFLNG
jgi:hypothetical protein